MNSFKQLYLNFLNSLKDEISLYKDPGKIWLLSGSISNTPGNLCLHICGNLNHFFGAVIGNTGYIRERDQEFSKRNLSREELFGAIDETKIMIGKIFDDLTQDDINKIYPINKFGENVTYGFIFSRLVSHLSYHLGQINYHRRLTDL
ncbi:MAG: DinB family protein [Ignavibacteria bacterium]|nr:DinB family protein [Ignavibacteria bacterium]